MNKDLKQKLKKAWWFIWESNSIWSWILNVILAFVLIKFLVYPGLGFAFQTTHPIVAVVSESMEHDGSFEDWWDSTARCGELKLICTQNEWYAVLGISKERFKEFKYKNGFNKGDLMVLRGTSAEDIQVGDTIVFKSKSRDPIIHRVVKITTTAEGVYFQTKGDHNSKSIAAPQLNELNILEDETIGYEKYDKVSKAVLRIPFLGYIKILFVSLIT